jgi:hypothetical protein
VRPPELGSRRADAILPRAALTPHRHTADAALPLLRGPAARRHDDMPANPGAVRTPSGRAAPVARKRATAGEGADGRAGRVISAAEHSYAGLEAAARVVEAKGVFFDRGVHRHARPIERWLHELNEEDFPYGEYAAEQLLVAPPQPPRDDCDSSDCEDASCQDPAEGHALAQPGGVSDACTQLVADLPSAFREAVRRDAEALALTSVRLCPDAPWLTLRLEIVQYNACTRWHQDNQTCRSIINYVGPGTCTADDTAVLWGEFDKGGDKRDTCVPRGSVKQMKTNAVLLMKGDAWPGIHGQGLTHKAPGEDTGFLPKRLLLKVDLHDWRPAIADPLDFASGSDYASATDSDGKAGDGDGVRRSVAVKRLATSEGFTSAKAWKMGRRR